jgi:hypothetical protein
MSWQELIYSRLNHHEGYTKLILDKTGILLHASFLEYIKSITDQVRTAHSLSDILVMIKQPGNFVISPLIDLPSYLDEKVDTIIFDYNHLPIDIDYCLAQTLKMDECISLLSYLVDSNNFCLIDTLNISQLLDAAHSHEKQQKVMILAEILNATTKRIENYKDILELGEIWGQYIYCCFEAEVIPNQDLIIKIDKAVENRILEGELKKSFYEPTSNLKTVNKIRAYIKSMEKMRIALICFDGMGVAEWQLLKNSLSKKGFSFTEKYLFALVPTITKISRSSIYYGDYQSVYSLTSPNEQKQLEQYFKDKPFKFFREGEIRNEDSLLGVDLVSIIYNVFDDIAHDTNLPPGDCSKSLYFMNLINYLSKSHIENELLLLKELGYSMFFFSDHGCVVATGNGQRIDKYLIELSSKRATLINKSDLSQFYNVNHYKIPFIYEDKVALLAKDRTIFTSGKKVEISHGGITLDELVVPFVEVIN